MGRTFYCGLKNLATIILLVSVGFCQANPQTPGASSTQPGISEQEKAELVKKLDQLLQQNQSLEDQARQVEEQNRRLRDEIREIREKLASQPVAGSQEPAQISDEQKASAPAQATTRQVSGPTQPGEERVAAATVSMAQEQKPDENKKWGKYTPNLGFKVVDTEHGDLSVSLYTYTRYLNQRLLDATYTNAFGSITTLQQRQDFQIQKLQFKFLGWVMSPKFRYFLYAWTSNATQGQGAQVVLAGNLNYTFNKHFNFAGGITSLPGTRSVEGNFPFWLGVDTRLIADEFFRPSYTSGIWARGQIVNRLSYQVMLGNNLSTLGVSAAQLNNKPDTFASALIWMPSTGEFGTGFGDFEDHQRVATRFAAHYTRSNEDTQEQPNSDQFENTQIRLEDGTVIFTPNIFGKGTTVTDLTYQMNAFDAGVKYH